MKFWLFLIVFLIPSLHLFAQADSGSGGFSFFWIFILLVPLAAFLLVDLVKAKRRGKKWWMFKFYRVDISLEKNRLYFPDYLKLIIENVGRTDVDIAQPLLIFENLMMKRKFRLKGINDYHFYPLYLDAGKSHSLQIDLDRFYRYDKRLKRYPKTRVVIFDVKGKRLGSQSLFLRKTLFKY